MLKRPRFGLLLIAGTAPCLLTISDGFVYLILQRQFELSPSVLPLLYVATALGYLLMAIPMGALADRIGRERVFVGGYALLLLVYALLTAPSAGNATFAFTVLLLGAYYAATDGVLMALASAALPTSVRTSGLAVLTTAISLGRLVASVLFGALWTSTSVEVAVRIFLFGLLAMTAIAAIALHHAGKGLPHDVVPTA